MHVETPPDRPMTRIPPDGCFLHEQQVGRSNYCINLALYPILTGGSMTEPSNGE
jgi:hypothetical protein